MTTLKDKIRDGVQDFFLDYEDLSKFDVNDREALVEKICGEIAHFVCQNTN